MEAKIMDWVNRLDQNTKDFEDAFGHLLPEILNWKVNAKKWSMGQVIDHLIATTRAYEGAVNKLAAGKQQLPFLGKRAFMTKFVGKMLLGAVQPDRKRKVSTFAVFEPTTSEIDGNIVKKFSESQSVLKNMIRSSQTLLEQNALICSPVSRQLVFPLEKAFEVLVTHQQRHLKQALEVLDLYKNGV